MSTPRAADLPVGSEILIRGHVRVVRDDERWMDHDSWGSYADNYLDAMIEDGTAEVTRIGDGQEQ